MDKVAIDQVELDLPLTEVTDEALESAATRSSDADPTGHETGSRACC